jgi:hypothetical protein
MKKHPPLDASGNRVRAGDMVRVIGVPDLSGMDPICEKETRLVFEHLIGKYKRIQDFDESGCAHLSFRILKGQSKGRHSLWVEPFLLKVKQSAEGK